MSTLRVLGLDVSNWKRVKIARLEFDEDSRVYRIGGENGNGKSSILTALQETIQRAHTYAGKVHRGADLAQVRVTLGTFAEGEPQPWYKVIRQVDTKGTKLEVTDLRHSAKIQDAKAFLGQLFGDTMVDPEQFYNADPRDRRARLMLLGGIDDSDLVAKLKEARENEKYCARQQAEAEGVKLSLEARASDLDQAPDEEVDVSEIGRKLREAQEHNGKIDLADQDLQSAREHLKRCDDHVKELRRQLEEAEKALDMATGNVGQKVERLTELGTRIDVSPIEAELDSVGEINRRVAEKRKLVAAREKWQAAEKETAKALQEIKNLESERRELLAAAKFPVPGLGFDDTDATYNGKPFTELSDGEKLRVATAIALAQGGECPIVIIRNGSLLGNKSMRILQEVAEAYQGFVLVEIVANHEEGQWDRKCEFYIEDGEIVTSDPTEKQAVLL